MNLQKPFFAIALTVFAACSETAAIPVSADDSTMPVARANYVSANMLLGTSRDTSSRLCQLSYYDVFEPVIDVRVSQVGIDHDVETTVPRHFTGLGIAAVNDPVAREQLRGDLLNNARAGGFLSLDDDISVNRMLQPVLVAYGQNKSAFSAAEQQEIEVWFNRIVNKIERSENTTGLPRLHNIRYRNALNQMLLGIVSNNDRRVQNAIRVYRSAINGLRNDGSFQDDSERGGSSLNYQADSTATLVTIAELAANQGIDLYSYGNDKTISTAVNFTLDATLNTDLIFPYARRSSERWQDKAEFTARTPWTGWQQQSNAEWAFYWIDRFPNSAETAKILTSVEYVQRKLENRVNADWDFDWRVGGSAACFTSG